jgi:hypothetical protein
MIETQLHCRRILEVLFNIIKLIPLVIHCNIYSILWKTVIVVRIGKGDRTHFACIAKLLNH